MIKFSSPGKLPCRSWSLQAGKTCPGSIDKKTKKPVQVCAGCYAKFNYYTLNKVKNIREHNRTDWKRDDWVQNMVEELDNDRYFRWFDSGDIYHHELAEKIFQVIQNTPHCNHWLPTKSYKIPKIKVILEKIKLLPNAMVRYSADIINGQYSSEHGSTVIPNLEFKTNAFVCPAPMNNGKCGKCRVCWNKNVPVVAYIAHGKVLVSHIKKMVA